MSIRHPKTEEDDNGIAKNFSSGYALGMNIVTSTLVGGAMGYGIDYLFGTTPWFMILFLFLGFAAGIRTIWQALQARYEKEEKSTDSAK